MNASFVLGGIAVALVVAGAVLASLDDDGIALLVALALQYGGVAITLALQNGPVDGLIGVVIGLGCLAILATAGTLRSAADPAVRLTAGARWLGASITGLAVAGAIGLAISDPLFDEVRTDIVVGTLVLVGLLFTLLGGASRLICGLIFISSVAALMVRLADPHLSPIDSLLLALVQLGVCIGLNVLWSPVRSPLAPARRRLRRTHYRPAPPAARPATEPAASDVTEAAR